MNRRNLLLGAAAAGMTATLVPAAAMTPGAGIPLMADAQVIHPDGQIIYRLNDRWFQSGVFV